MHVYNARSKISFHKNICIYQYFILQGCVTTNVAFISRIVMVMGKPEMGYGYCSCKHSENNIPSCLLCRVYAVHQCDDYCGDSGYQPVWPPAGTRDQTEALGNSLDLFTGILPVLYYNGQFQVNRLAWSITQRLKMSSNLYLHAKTLGYSQAKPLVLHLDLPCAFLFGRYKSLLWNRKPNVCLVQNRVCWDHKHEK